MVYLRAINSDAWLEVVSNERDALDSDVVSDLSTRNHELSVWEVDDDLSNIDDVALAMALSKDQIRDLTLVMLSPKSMNESKKFNFYPEIQSQPGETAYTAMVNNHKNFMINSLWEMGFLAEYIAELISTNFERNCTLYNAQDIIKILNDRIVNGVIDETYLKHNKAGKWAKEAKVQRQSTS